MLNMLKTSMMQRLGDQGILTTPNMLLAKAYLNQAKKTSMGTASPLRNPGEGPLDESRDKRSRLEGDRPGAGSLAINNKDGDAEETCLAAKKEGRSWWRDDRHDRRQNESERS